MYDFIQHGKKRLSNKHPNSNFERSRGNKHLRSRLTEAGRQKKERQRDRSEIDRRIKRQRGMRLKRQI